MLLSIIILTLTLSGRWWGRCKKYLPEEEGREGGEKSAPDEPLGAGAQTRDHRVPGEGSQLHAMGVCGY